MRKISAILTATLLINMLPTTGFAFEETSDEFELNAEVSRTYEVSDYDTSDDTLVYDDVTSSDENEVETELELPEETFEETEENTDDYNVLDDTNIIVLDYVANEDTNIVEPDYVVEEDTEIVDPMQGFVTVYDHDGGLVGIQELEVGQTITQTEKDKTLTENTATKTDEMLVFILEEPIEIDGFEVMDWNIVETEEGITFSSSLRSTIWGLLDV